MASPQTAAELVDLISRGNLLSGPAVRRLRAQVPESGQPGADAREFARALARQRVLTSFHCEHLLKGRTGGFFVGKYRILDLLGVGGMGRVYLAEQTSMKRAVALKMLPKTVKDGDSTLARFRREAHAAAKLRHPNIAQAYDFDQAGDTHFISMEYVAGATLQDWVDRTEPLDPAQACDIVRQAALGLQAAHAADFVHRDIKPGNIMVEPDGTVKVLDLGLVVSRAPSQKAILLSQDGVMLGTADYIAPEQAMDSHKVDIRADVYSLGCVLYFLLTGEVPFPDSPMAKKLVLHQTAGPRPVREVAPHVPEGVADVLARMTRVDPKGRYPEPAQVARALEPFAVAKNPAYDALKLVRYPLTVVEKYLKHGGAAPPSTGAHALRPRADHGEAAAGASADSTKAVSVPTTARGTPTEPTPVPKKGKGGMVTLLALVLVCGGGAGAYFALTGGPGAAVPDKGGPAARAAAPKTKQVPPADTPKSAKPPAPATTLPFPESLVTAPAGSTVRVPEGASGPITLSGKGAHGGRVTVTGSSPGQVIRPSNTKPLVRISSAAGAVVEDLILDGGGRAAPMIVVEGECPGLTLRGLTLRNFRGPGILFLSTRGTEAAPVRLEEVRFLPGKKLWRDPGVEFRASGFGGAAAYFVVADCTFEGSPYCIRVGQPIDGLEISGCEFRKAKTAVWFSSQQPGVSNETPARINGWRIAGTFPPDATAAPEGAAWKTVTHDRSFIPTKHYVGADAEGAVFLTTTVQSEAAGSRGLFLGIDVPAAVSVNGVEVFRSATTQNFREQEFITPVNLRAGANRLAVKLFLSGQQEGRFSALLSQEAIAVPPRTWTGVHVHDNVFDGAIRGIEISRFKKAEFAITGNRFKKVRQYPMLASRPDGDTAPLPSVESSGNRDGRGPAVADIPAPGFVKIPLGAE